jgi:outer membrane receptor protein involved in Fe transport
LIERYLTEDINIGGEYLYSSSQYYRGDEAHENNKIDGHSVVNMYLNYGVTPQLELSVRMNNL